MKSYITYGKVSLLVPLYATGKVYNVSSGLYHVYITYGKVSLLVPLYATGKVYNVSSGLYHVYITYGQVYSGEAYKACIIGFIGFPIVYFLHKELV